MPDPARMKQNPWANIRRGKKGIACSQSMSWARATMYEPMEYSQASYSP